MKKLLALTSLLFISFLSHGQSIENVKIQMAGDQIIVNYDLVTANSDYNFSLDLYSSHNNYSSPLTEVSGDIGLDVEPGTFKIITWEAAQELGEFEGEIGLEIRVRFFIPFLRLLKPGIDSKWKRGKIQNIEWTGGSSSDIRIDLFQDNQRLQTVSTVQNTGVFRWNVPSALKPGKNYQLLLSDSRNIEDQVYSEAFYVTHKIPILLKGAAVVALGAIVYLLIPTSEESIPNPPPVPDN